MGDKMKNIPYILCERDNNLEQDDIQFALFGGWTTPEITTILIWGIGNIEAILEQFGGKVGKSCLVL